MAEVVQLKTIQSNNSTRANQVPISRLETYFPTIAKNLLKDDIIVVDSQVRLVMGNRNEPNSELRARARQLKLERGREPEDPTVSGIIKMEKENNVYNATITPLPSLRAHALWHMEEQQSAFSYPVSLAIARDLVSVNFGGKEYLEFVKDEDGTIVHPNHKKFVSFGPQALEIMAKYTLPEDVSDRNGFRAANSKLVGVSAKPGQSTFFQFITPFAEFIQSGENGQTAQILLQKEWMAGGKLDLVPNTADYLVSYLHNPNITINGNLRSSIVVYSIYEHRDRAVALMLEPYLLGDLKKDGQNWKNYYELSKVYGTLGNSNKVLEYLRAAQQRLPSEGFEIERVEIKRFIGLQTGEIVIHPNVFGVQRQPEI